MPPRETSLGGVGFSVVWVLVCGVWLFVLHDNGEGPLLWCQAHLVGHVIFQAVLKYPLMSCIYGAEIIELR